MEILFENKFAQQPLVSIVLLDWSVRESYHVLHYLNKQTVPREKYEIIWIEYYDRKPKEIESKLMECSASGKQPVLDTWIVLDLPEDVYYHKHLMYNVGIVAGRGKIVTFMDSDAMVTPTFIESIIKSFEENSNIVLHIDEVRNVNRKFYPFNYPSIKEVMEEGCINFRDGKTFGLLDKKDPIHSLNYGACMCALRADLISIGGADEHMDYLGHICGPYEITFRLVNAGKKEVWHQEELLYHTWHPGAAGVENYCGPHDGFNMSATALKVINSGRILPLDENPAIKKLRLSENSDRKNLLLQTIDANKVKDWTIERAKEENRYFSDTLIKLKKNPLSALHVASSFIKILARQFFAHVSGFMKKPKSFREILKVGHYTYAFLRSRSKNNKYILESCEKILRELALNNIGEFVIYGTGDVAKVMHRLTENSPIKIAGVYDDGNQNGRKFSGMDIMPLEALKTYDGKIVIAEPDEIKGRIEKLLQIGIERNRIIPLF